MVNRFETGPFLQTAVICEKVLQEPTAIYSLIRIFDRLTLQARGPTPEMPEGWEIPAAFSFFFLFRSGSALGKLGLSLRVESPDGQRSDFGRTTLFFEGGERGAATQVDAQIGFRMEGLYWFFVYLEGVEVTRMPLRVILMYEQQQQVPGSGM